MLTKIPFDSERNLSRQLVSGETRVTVPVAQSAANASRWVESISHARRMRRQRRLERAERRGISGWSVRAW